MSQASLPGLAPELKIQIFVSMDSFSLVAILSSSSRTFHNIWTSNTKSICDAVLQRAIECLTEAEVLLDAQDSSPQAVNFPDLETSQEENSPFQKAIERAQRVSVNADMASSALLFFDYAVCTSSRFGGCLSPTERTHFIQAYYGAMTVVLFPHEALPETLIASWDMLHFQRVREILSFLIYSQGFYQSPRQYLIIGSVDGCRNKLWGEWTAGLNVKIANHRMKLLDHDFLAVAPSGHLFKPPKVPNCYFIAYEHYTKTKDSPRGAHLAELLALLPEGALRRACAEIRPEKHQWVSVSKSVV